MEALEEQTELDPYLINIPIKNFKGFRNVRKSIIEASGYISQYFDPSHFFEDHKS